MKTILLVLSGIFAATAAFANDPVTEIESFQCHPRGGSQNYTVWTEITSSGQVVTLGTLGASGVEGIEKFTASRADTNDTVSISSNDKTLSLVISNDFDGEFYAAELSLKKNGGVVNQELACESFVSDTKFNSEMPRSTNRLSTPSPRYVWTCTAAPHNNYNYRWFYGQHVLMNVANMRAIELCNNFYGAPICISSCR